MNDNKGRQLLLVDDDESMLHYLSTILEREGFSVWRAAHGQAALEVITSQGAHLELMVLDMIMPGMDGEHVLQAARQLHPALPCLFISGCYNANIIARSLQMGLCDFLAKPFTASALLEKIEAMRLPPPVLQPTP